MKFTRNKDEEIGTIKLEEICVTLKEECSEIEPKPLMIDPRYTKYEDFEVFRDQVYVERGFCNFLPIGGYESKIVEFRLKQGKAGKYIRESGGLLSGTCYDLDIQQNPDERELAEYLLSTASKNGALDVKRFFIGAPKGSRAKIDNFRYSGGYLDLDYKDFVNLNMPITFKVIPKCGSEMKDGSLWLMQGDQYQPIKFLSH